MNRLFRRMRKAGLVLSVMGLEMLLSVFLTMEMAGHAVSAAETSRPLVRGNSEAGRNLFNGKGVCYYCHGIDGYRDKLPELERHTAGVIARLKPSPTDLRDPEAQHLRTDKERGRIIREGHTGTGMFPDPTLKDAEITDVLAYLSVLRGERTDSESPQKSSPSS